MHCYAFILDLGLFLSDKMLKNIIMFLPIQHSGLLLEFHRVGQELFCSVGFNVPGTYLPFSQKATSCAKGHGDSLGTYIENLLSNFDFILCDALVPNWYLLLILTVYAGGGGPLCLLLLSKILTSSNYTESGPSSLVNKGHVINS